MPSSKTGNMPKPANVINEDRGQQSARSPMNRKASCETIRMENKELCDGFTPVKTKVQSKFERKIATAASELQVESLTNLSRGTLDVQSINAAQEKDLHAGPTVGVYIGAKLARNHVPARALMAVSERANALFNANPAAKEFRLPANSANSAVVATILYRLVSGPTANFKIPQPATFIQAVQTYQAAEVLGMGKHAESIGKTIRFTISHRLLDYEEIDVVLASLPVTDNTFKTLANDLSFRRHKGLILDGEDFAAYLKKNPKLGNAVAEIASQHEAARQAHREQRERAAEHRQRQHEKSIAANVRKSVNGPGSIKSATPDQAEVQRKMVGRGT
jgi:hypothetical protein